VSFSPLSREDPVDALAQRSLLETSVLPSGEVPGPGRLGDGSSLGIGDTIAGTYCVQGVLGSGGMGTVYHCHDETLGRAVAIKLVHEDLLARRGVREAFLEEARSMARVRHENVVTIHAFGIHREQPYLVMEYVAGSNLARWMAQREVPSLADAVKMLDALCLGVAAIHDTGAVHRDIKPGNILIEGKGRIAVTDFGLSTAHTDVQYPADRLALGTPAYIAPELARGEPIDARTAPALDIYALGLLAFELITGQRPFEAASTAAMMQAHAYGEPPAPSSMRAGIPRAFDEPILHALAKSPSDRVPSAEALRRSLQRSFASAAEYPHGLKILSVDDEVDILIALQELLRMTFPGAEVISVSTTETAIEMVRRVHPDIVITDLDMPGGGGSAITVAMRADPGTATIPIIVMTGHGGASDWGNLRKMGADRFLVKPIDFDQLSSTIRKLVPGERQTG
jgi:serine/threonine-protein kinase